MIGTEGKAMRYKIIKKDILTIPNAISFFRLLLIPVILWFYCRQKNYFGAAVIAMFSAATDIIDGKIARHCSMVSDVGKVLDPVADKLTQVALMICLHFQYPYIWVLLLLFGIKESLLAIWGYLAIKTMHCINSAKWYGKFSTAVLYVVMIYLFLFPEISTRTVFFLIIICGLVMLLSLILYGRFYNTLLTKEILRENKREVFVGIWRTLLFLIWGVIVVALFIHRKEFTSTEILELTPTNSFLAALTMLAFFALKSISIVLFSGILYVANGILFPLPIAIFLNVLGTAIMVTIPYIIGKRNGSASVAQIVNKYPKADELRKFRRKNDFFFVLIIRLAGILPCDIVSMYMGAICVDYSKYLIGCLVGLLPRSITFSIMGMSITDIHSPLFVAALCVELLLMVLSIFLYRIYYRKNKGDSSSGECNSREK